MSKPLLRIELEDINADPKVFYNGKEITNKVRIQFDYETDTDVINLTHIKIEHLEIDKVGLPSVNVIEHNPKPDNKQIVATIECNIEELVNGVISKLKKDLMAAGRASVV